MFNPEFLNRLDDVIVFHPLSQEHIAQIVGDPAQGRAEAAGGGGAHAQAHRCGAVDFLVEARLRREVRRASAEAGDPAVHRGSALGEDPDSASSAEGDEIEVDVAADGTKLDFRVLASDDQGLTSANPRHMPAVSRPVCPVGPAGRLRVYIPGLCARLSLIPARPARCWRAPLLAQEERRHRALRDPRHASPCAGNQRVGDATIRADAGLAPGSR